MLDILSQDLCTSSLDRIYRHLWLAGLPKAARPLHRQKLLGRTIVITENPNEHLIWHASRIFIKPLPEYLLCHEYWMTQGNILTQEESLYRFACGFLLSYCWLICTKSDLAIARDCHLLPPYIKWEEWVYFVTDILTAIDPDTLESVSQRYHYGELRLSRLNLIYRLAPDVFSVHNFIRGFMSEPLWSKAFLERNFAWIFSVFGFVTIVASAMQVGLGTRWLQGSSRFQGASVVFTAGSLVLAAASVVLVGSVWGFLTIYHIFWAKKNLKAVHDTRQAKRYRQVEGV